MRVGYVEPAPVVVARPPLVEVEPGVQVIEDYDQPVFYSDNLYWRYDGGVWYSSQWHDRGWYRNERVPERIRHVDRPESYRHYHSGVRREETIRREEPRREEGIRREEPRREEPRREEGVRREEPRHEEPRREEHPAPGPVVRDHRTAPPPPAKKEEKKPVVRDHRN